MNIGGHRGSLSDLSQKLNEIEGVQDGVFFLPDDTGTSVTRLIAFVVAPGKAAEHILSALRTVIDPVFLPRPLHLVPRLPRNETGKLTREALLGLMMRACAVNIEDLRKTLTNFISDNTPTVPGASEVDTQPTLGFQRVIQRAIMHVQSASNGKKEVTGANVLVAIFGEKDSHAVYYLHQQGVTRLDVVNFISHGVRKDQQAEPQKAPDGGEEAPAEGQQKESPLDQFTQNLNKLASEGKIDPLIGREAEVERVIQTLCRRRKNNPLLVGEAGVGKTAIAEGLAWRITQSDVPEILQGAIVYSLDMGALLAGTNIAVTLSSA